MKADVEARIEALLGAGHVREALVILADFPDLRHNDLPAVSKGTLKALAEDSDSVAALADALASVSPSIRRFSRKYVPKLGDVGNLLLAHLVEAGDPFRRVTEERPGLAGSFDGYASPVGQAIVDGRMSIRVREPAVYSQAARYAREVAAAMVGATAAAKVSL